MLTSLLPPSVCASCRLCCHFRPESVWETPALEPECVSYCRSLGVPLAERVPGVLTFELDFASAPLQESADCPLLDRCSGCRLPRAERPLECRLWPLRLMHEESGSLVVAFYAACPGLATVSHEQLLELAASLRPLLLSHAARCPASVRPLYPHYTVLCSLDAQDTAIPLPCPGC